MTNSIEQRSSFGGATTDRNSAPGDGGASEKQATTDLEQGRKDDTGKLRFDLLPPKALRALAEVYTVGAVKYGDRNWEDGLLWGRVYAAIQRHLWAFWGGEDLDPEDGLPHLAHAAWGCFALMEYAERPELDDRSKKELR